MNNPISSGPVATGSPPSASPLGAAAPPSGAAAWGAALLWGILAVGLRIPVLDESFWVDELHTSWCIAGDFSDVLPRASAGHQSPLYYWGLFLWRQLFGDSEWILRGSSVMAGAIATVVISHAASRRFGSLLVGGLVGVTLAIDQHMFFFSAELRPYAWVVLVASVALAGESQCWYRVLRCSRSTWWAAASVLGFAIHPAAGLPIVMTAVGMFLKPPLQPKRASSASILWLVFWWVAAAIVAFVLWQNSLAATWDARGQWESFAALRTWPQLLNLWDWLLWGLPPLVLLVWRRKLFREAWQPLGMLHTLTLIVAVHAVFALGSLLDVVHLWHRRYLIAMLPWLVWLPATAFGEMRSGGTGFHSAGGGSATGSARGRTAVPVAMLMALWLVALLWQQGTISDVMRGSIPVSRHREDWRLAIDFVRKNVPRDHRIYVDAGLIESSAPFLELASVDDLPEALDHYLSYPLRGTDTVTNEVQAFPATLAGYRSFVTENAAGQRFQHAVVVSRRDPGPILKNMKPELAETVETVRFPGVTVWMHRSSPTREQPPETP
ncbi:MAG: hypothetical protein AAF958_15240 [Planctomycetota bacterium]